MADRWLVTLDEDPSEAFLLYDGSMDDAITEACLEFDCGPDDVSVRPWTAEDERDVRNARRRERYAERKAAGDFDRPLDPEDAAAHAAIPMMAWLALSDERTGQPRCPSCGRFRRWRDFVGAPSSARIPGGVVDFAPRCRACRTPSTEPA